MHHVVRVVSLMLLVAGAATVARADGSAESLVVQATEELDRLEYEKARETLARAEHSGRSSSDELAEIYRLSGIVLGSYGDEGAAERYFARWLALRPDGRLDDGYAPKISEPFARARVDMEAREPLRVASFERDVEAGARERTVGVAVESDPLDMVAGAVARFETPDGATRRVRASGDGPYTVVIPKEVDGAIELAAIDRHGNRLAELTYTPQAEEKAAPIVEVPLEPTDDGPSGRPIYARWYLWGGVATVLAGGSAYFGLRAQSDQRRLDGLIRNSADHDYAAARDVEARGRRHALLANATGAAAIVAGGAAAVLFITQLGSDSDVEQTARAYATPLRGGGAAVLELSF